MGRILHISFAIIAILLSFGSACCSGGKHDAAQIGNDTAAATDSLAGDSLAATNPFPLLNYPESWYLSNYDADGVINEDFIVYPYLNLHYSTFETVVREYGGPSFYREIDYRNGSIESEYGYGNTSYLDSILKKVPEAHIMLFHWENTTNNDSTQCGYDMDLYFLNDGDSMRVIYGLKFRPGLIAAP